MRKPAKQTRTHTFAEVPGSERVALPGAKALGPANPHTTIEVLLKLRRKKELPDIDARPQEPVSREQLANEYGAREEDMSKVKEAMQGFGLRVVSENLATRSIRLLGTIAQIETAFRVKLFDYAHAGGNYRGRVGPVHVPAELKDIVRGVFGLDNRRAARRGRRPSHTGATIRSLSSIPSSWYLPSWRPTTTSHPATVADKPSDSSNSVAATSSRI